MNQQITKKCDLCNAEFQFSQGKYDGKFIKTYGITICTTCYDGSHDGYQRHHNDKLLKALKDNKLPTPKLNDQGLFPRG